MYSFLSITILYRLLLVDCKICRNCDHFCSAKVMIFLQINKKSGHVTAILIVIATVFAVTWGFEESNHISFFCQNMSYTFIIYYAQARARCEKSYNIESGDYAILFIGSGLLKGGKTWYHASSWMPILLKIQASKSTMFWCSGNKRYTVLWVLAHFCLFYPSLIEM